MCLYIKDRFFSLNLVPLYMWTLIIIIDVVVVVDEDAYYWVYLSSDHLFQVYYKVRQVLLQSATAFFITKCDGLLLQSATAFLLQSATSVITKCDRCYKVWQFYYKVRRLLQSATVHSGVQFEEVTYFLSYPLTSFWFQIDHRLRSVF